MIAAGCGTDSPGSTVAADSVSQATSTTVPYDGPVSYEIEPTSVARGSLLEQLVVTYSDLPVKNGDPACTITLAVEPHGNDVQVNLVTSLVALQPGPPSRATSSRTER
jgi:hypothetical protein